MRLTIQSSNQLQSIFGGGYVLEQHSDATDSCLPRSEVHGVIGCLTASMIDEVMKSLRSALSLR